jgi:hypothetical protein
MREVGRESGANRIGRELGADSPELRAPRAPPSRPDFCIKLLPPPPSSGGPGPRRTRFPLAARSVRARRAPASGPLQARSPADVDPVNTGLLDGR